MKNGRKKQEQIHLGAHGEDYGNWMPVSMLWLVGGLAALAAVISLLSFAVFHITALGVVFVIAALLLLALMDHLDQAAVCLRGRRHDGAGPPGRPLPSGF